MKNLNPLYEYKKVTRDMISKMHLPDKFALTRVASKARKSGKGVVRKTTKSTGRRLTRTNTSNNPIEIGNSIWGQ